MRGAMHCEGLTGQSLNFPRLFYRRCLEMLGEAYMGTALTGADSSG
jgi:hypothetical protein